MTPEQMLERLENMRELSTQGSWGVKLGHVGAEREMFLVVPGCDGIRFESPYDAAFVAGTQAALPWLLAMVEEALAAREFAYAVEHAAEEHFPARLSSSKERHFNARAKADRLLAEIGGEG